MNPYRSLLFVPGHKDSWVPKAVASGAHAVILDLEDAVPETQKKRARESVAASIDHLVTQSRTGVIVRVNDLHTPYVGQDLEAVVREGLTAVLLPKVHHLNDIVAFDALLRHFETVAGVPVGTVGIIPSLETARGIVNVESIAQGPRVISLMAAAARDADIAREVGFRWSAEGFETLHLRSRVVLAARAAGLEHIVLGLWQDIEDLDGLRSFALGNRNLGFGGQVVIHPSHVPVVNEVYAHSPTDLARFAAIVEAYEAAAVAGSGAAVFNGAHIDLAHVQYARAVLATTPKEGDL